MHSGNQSAALNCAFRLKQTPVAHQCKQDAEAESQRYNRRMAVWSDSLLALARFKASFSEPSLDTAYGRPCPGPRRETCHIVSEGVRKVCSISKPRPGRGRHAPGSSCCSCHRRGTGATAAGKAARTCDPRPGPAGCGVDRGAAASPARGERHNELQEATAVRNHSRRKGALRSWLAAAIKPTHSQGFVRRSLANSTSCSRVMQVSLPCRSE